MPGAIRGENGATPPRNAVVCQRNWVEFGRGHHCAAGFTENLGLFEVPINNCFTIIADRSSIEIGDRCLIGPNFFACDSDFHGLELANRMNGNYETTPIFIGNDVFIGSDVKVLKGSRIGNGSVIGSGSVVVGDVEEHSIYAGVPAKKLRSLSA